LTASLASARTSSGVVPMSECSRNDLFQTDHDRAGPLGLLHGPQLGQPLPAEAVADPDGVLFDLHDG